MRNPIPFASLLLLTAAFSAGCGDLWLEPDPRDVDAAPLPPDAAIPPDAPPPPPPPRPPLPMGDNAPRDEYDVTNHRLLLPDCSNSTLVGLDLATGRRDVLVDTWPWTEPGNLPCVREVVASRDGRRAFAIVSRSIPSEDSSCRSQDLVDIDLETGEVAQMEQIDYQCCHGDCDYREYSVPQLDEYRSRLLVIEAQGGADYATYELSSIPVGTGQDGQKQAISPDCLPDSESCPGEPWPEFRAFTFDPAAPNERVLLFSREYTIGNYLQGQYMMDTYDVVTGARVSRQPIQLLDGDAAAGDLRDASIDIETQRVLLTWGEREWLVVAVDLVTGEETLIYDGRPTRDGGAQINCNAEAAFDSRERRLLISEQGSSGHDCNEVFAVDVDTGAFTRILPRFD